MLNDKAKLLEYKLNFLMIACQIVEDTENFIFYFRNTNCGTIVNVEWQTILLYFASTCNAIITSQLACQTLVYRGLLFWTSFNFIWCKASLRVIVDVVSLHGVKHTKDVSVSFAVRCVVCVTLFWNVFRILYNMRNNNCCTDVSLLLLCLYAVIFSVLY